MFQGIPSQLTFGQIALLAHDRKLWKRLATRVTQANTAAHMFKDITSVPWAAKMLRQHRTPTPAPKRQHCAPTPKTPSTTIKPKTLWPISDKHTKPAAKAKVKRKGLTDKQRGAEAHAHFILNHGKPSDAARYLQHKASANTTEATRHKLTCMARTQAPTWEEANEAVFSSDDSSYSSDTQTPATTTARQPAIMQTATTTITHIHTAVPRASPTHTPRPIQLQGHLHPEHKQSTHNTHTQFMFSPIPNITHTHNEWTQSPHNECKTPSHRKHTPCKYDSYVTILHDTFLVVHN